MQAESTAAAFIFFTVRMHNQVISGISMQQGLGAVMYSGFKYSLMLLAMGLALLILPANAQEGVRDKNLNKNSVSSVFTFENEQLRLRLRPRTSEQMAGFFEARGFPEVMIKKLSGYCFFTVVVKNKMTEELWMDLSDWGFVGSQQSVKRLPRTVWPPLWKQLNIPLASQSTFRWTLLPETLKFYAQESEGGNIILEKTGNRFSLQARFSRGEEKQPIVAIIENVQCADALGGTP